MIVFVVMFVRSPDVHLNISTRDEGVDGWCPPICADQSRPRLVLLSKKAPGLGFLGRLA